MTIDHRLDQPAVERDSGASARGYSLADLFVLITAVAIALALLRAWAIFGAVICFIAANVLTLLVYPRWRPKELLVQQTAFDLTWGVVMPLICLAGLIVSPALPAIDDPSGPRFAAPWLWFFGWQMLLLCVWLVFRERVGRGGAFLSGSFILAVLAASTIGLLLLPLAVVGSFFYGIGLLGFTPIFTAIVYARAGFAAEQLAADTHAGWRTSLLALAGFVAAVIPLIMWVIFAALAG
jgi:hypothetical protein